MVHFSLFWTGYILCVSLDVLIMINNGDVLYPHGSQGLLFNIVAKCK